MFTFADLYYFIKLTLSFLFFICMFSNASFTDCFVFIYIYVMYLGSMMNESPNNESKEELDEKKEGIKFTFLDLD